MLSFKSFEQRLFQVNNQNFNEFAISLFRYQAKNNSVYHDYISGLNINIKQVKSFYDIPFLPISFFKQHKIKTERWSEENIYESSGTTGVQASRHFVRDNGLYLVNCERIFKRSYGSLSDYHTLFLLPSYIERGNSSLVAMARHFIGKSQSEYSGFYLNNYSELVSTIESIRKNSNGKKMLLCGVSFALLELAETLEPNLSDVIIMETGGMKGRRKELIRAELHSILCERLNVPVIHSEYGMTELSSQAYSQGNGKFDTPPWMRILLRDINDPFDLSNNQSGGINVIDLANLSSCAFIETQDLGSINSRGELEILGRFDNSDIRGCNLLI